MKILIDPCCVCKKNTTQLAGFKYKKIKIDNAYIDIDNAYGYLCLNCGLVEWDYYHVINKKPGKKIEKTLGKFILRIFNED